MLQIHGQAEATKGYTRPVRSRGRAVRLDVNLQLVATKRCKLRKEQNLTIPPYCRTRRSSLFFLVYTLLTALSYKTAFSNKFGTCYQKQ